jgi:iron complex outermembrane receptor protein
MEVTVGATPLESQTLSWSFNVGLSWNRNRLVRKARSATDAGTVQVGGVGGFALATGSVFSRFVEGYPLYGYWTYPITGYADLNGDGVIQGGEVQVGDSASYVGAPFPNYTASFHHTVTLCSRVTVGATFSYENGLTQVNGLLAGAGNIQYTQAYNDPSISQATQAYLIAALVPGAGRAGSAMGFIQTVSELRFNALSVGYAVPASMTRSILRGRNLHVAVQGTNLGLWTNYRGKDPDVSMGMTELVRDFGVLPTPRAWQLSLRID